MPLAERFFYPPIYQPSEGVYKNTFTKYTCCDQIWSVKTQQQRERENGREKSLCSEF